MTDLSAYQGYIITINFTGEELKSLAYQGNGMLTDACLNEQNIQIQTSKLASFLNKACNVLIIFHKIRVGEGFKANLMNK